MGWAQRPRPAVAKSPQTVGYYISFTDESPSHFGPFSIHVGTRQDFGRDPLGSGQREKFLACGANDCGIGGAVKGTAGGQRTWCTSNLSEGWSGAEEAPFAATLAYEALTVSASEGTRLPRGEASRVDMRFWRSPTVF